MTIFEMQASHLYKFEVDELKRFKNSLDSRGLNIELFLNIEKDFLIAEYGCIFEDEMDIYVPDGHRELKDAKDETCSISRK